MKVVVSGGGAAGFFGAIACAERFPGAEVILVEKSPELLAKVSISGGGRCNVTHACFEPALLVKNYPRGGRELLGPFHRWQPRDTVEWFESRGVKLKTEPDGRMFPVTDKSSSITSCLRSEAGRAGVKVLTQCGLARVARGDRFELHFQRGEIMEADRLLLATGGNQNSIGFELAASLGHTIESPVPSLFTFHVDDARLGGLQGLSAPDAEVSVPGTALKQRGPVLITHWGLSGPAILKLSAWGARSLHDCDYRFELKVNWLPNVKREDWVALRTLHGRKDVAGWSPFKEIPNRLWQALVGRVNGTWAQISNAELLRIQETLAGCIFQVVDKSMFKDEFVTCGGVRLSEVNFKTMESRVCKGLYFGGEILDIDGVTGGFNFQSAWTTGWIAGQSMGEEQT